MSLNCILNRTRIRTSRAGSIFCCAGRENLGGVTKISPKVKQNVIVLFLLAAFAANGQQDLLRLEKSADAMGATYSIALYGYDRVQMEAAADAALHASRSRFRRSFSSFCRPASPTAGRATARSTSRWDR